MIEQGQPVPGVPIKLVNKSGTIDADSASVLGAGKIVLFTLPGAFTPTCHTNHLPGYVNGADRIKSAGVDRIICATVNDHHVVQAWAKDQNALGKVEFIADGNAALASALGLATDMRAGGMGDRFARAALIIDNGIVEAAFTEDAKGQVTSSGAPAILDFLEQNQTASIA